MKHDCSNCFYGGPGDPFECWDCWNGSHWIDICAYSKGYIEADDLHCCDEKDYPYLYLYEWEWVETDEDWDDYEDYCLKGD